MNTVTFSGRRKFRIGDTPIIRRRAVERIFGVSHLLIKDESRNHYGTLKDRRNRAAISRAMQEHVDKLVLITSGNCGYSLARLAEGSGIRVVCFIDKAIGNYIKERLRKYAHDVIEIDLGSKIYHSEDLLALARETKDEVIWDVTNGYHVAFQDIVGEIETENPDLLIVPLGSGEAYVGLYEGLSRYRVNTKLLGVGVHEMRGNTLILREKPSIADKLHTPFTPYRRRIEAILEEGHLYTQLSDAEIADAYEKIHLLIQCEPSSAAAFAALSEIDVKKYRKIIVVNSGRGIWEA